MQTNNQGNAVCCLMVQIFNRFNFYVSGGILLPYLGQLLTRMRSVMLYNTIRTVVLCGMFLILDIIVFLVFV